MSHSLSLETPFTLSWLQSKHLQEASSVKKDENDDYEAYKFTSYCKLALDVKLCQRCYRMNQQNDEQSYFSIIDILFYLFLVFSLSVFIVYLVLVFILFYF